MPRFQWIGMTICSDLRHTIQCFRHSPSCPDICMSIQGYPCDARAKTERERNRGREGAVDRNSHHRDPSPQPASVLPCLHAWALKPAHVQKRCEYCEFLSPTPLRDWGKRRILQRFPSTPGIGEMSLDMHSGELKYSSLFL